MSRAGGCGRSTSRQRVRRFRPARSPGRIAAPGVRNGERPAPAELSPGRTRVIRHSPRSPRSRSTPRWPSRCSACAGLSGASRRRVMCLARLELPRAGQRGHANQSRPAARSTRCPRPRGQTGTPRPPTHGRGELAVQFRQQPDVDPRVLAVNPQPPSGATAIALPHGIVAPPPPNPVPSTTRSPPRGRHPTTSTAPTGRLRWPRRAILVPRRAG